MIELTNYSVLDGEHTYYLKSEGCNRLHIVVRKWKMIYDKGSVIIHGNMNGYTYLGVLNFDKYGGAYLDTIYGSGASLIACSLEENGEVIRLFLQVREYSVYMIQSTDACETAHTTG